MRILQPDDQREEYAAAFTVKKVLVHLLKTAARAAHQSKHPNVWANAVAPVFRMETTNMEERLLMLGSAMNQMKQMEREVADITYDVVARAAPIPA